MCSITTIRMDTIDNQPSNSGATIDDFCRLCLRHCGAHWMRPWFGSTDSESVSIPDMLVYCCGLPSHLTNELPQRVCFPCTSRLEQAYSICRSFKEKEIVLDRFYSNGSVLDRLVKYNQFRFNEVIQVPEVPIIKSECTIEEPVITEPIQTADTIIESRQHEEESASNHPIVDFIPENTLDEKLMSEPCSPSNNFSENCNEDRMQSKQNIKNVKQLYEYTGSRATKSSHKNQYGAKRMTRVPLEPAEDGFFHCIYCPRKFPQRNRFMQHLGIHRAVMEQRYKCNFCGKIFGKNDHLVQHESRHKRVGGLITM